MIVRITKKSGIANFIYRFVSLRDGLFCFFKAEASKKVKCLAEPNVKCSAKQSVKYSLCECEMLRKRSVKGREKYADT